MVPNAGSCPSLCRLCKIFIPNLCKGKKKKKKKNLQLTEFASNKQKEARKNATIS